MKRQMPFANCRLPTVDVLYHLLDVRAKFGKIWIEPAERWFIFVCFAKYWNVLQYLQWNYRNCFAMGNKVVGRQQQQSKPYLSHMIGWRRWRRLSSILLDFKPIRQSSGLVSNQSRKFSLLWTFLTDFLHCLVQLFFVQLRVLPFFQ